MKPNETSSKEELLSWIDYLETKVERLHTHIEYLTEIDRNPIQPKPRNEDEPCYCDECLGI